MESVSIYLKEGESYIFLARAWREVVTYQDMPHMAIMFDWAMSRLLTTLGVRSVHLTYPDTGDLHQTFTFDEGVTLRVSAERAGLSWLRGDAPVKLPSEESINSVVHLLQRKRPPAFAEFKSETQIVPVNSGIQVPVGEGVKYFGAKVSAKEGSEVIDLEGKSGTLNVHCFLKGGQGALTETPGWVPTFERLFILGDEPPYYGVWLRLFPEPPQAGEQTPATPDSTA